MEEAEWNVPPGASDCPPVTASLEGRTALVRPQPGLQGPTSLQSTKVPLERPVWPVSPTPTCVISCSSHSKATAHLSSCFNKPTILPRRRLENSFLAVGSNPAGLTLEDSVTRLGLTTTSGRRAAEEAAGDGKCDLPSEGQGERKAVPSTRRREWGAGDGAGLPTEAAPQQERGKAGNG